jgi:alcohol dehydrogenase, propanol-preferring
VVTYVSVNSMPLRPILKKDLIVRSNETGTKSDIEEALQLSAIGKVASQIKIMDLVKLNTALDMVKRGEVMGKLVLDLRSSTS